MPCYHPWTAFQPLGGGPISMVERADMRQVTLPCGQCVGCRLERARQWAVRCLHESKLHEFNCFITLTYDNEHLPVDGSLNYRAFQLFMKRARKYFKSRVRFYMCGEYGDLNGRPHFHAILFGVDFHDKYYWKRSGDFKIYRSAALEKLWPFGASSIGAVSFESAGYVARYCVQKVTGQLADKHYERVDGDGVVYHLMPEFNRMSLKPGIGAGFFFKFLDDFYPHGKCVVRGVESNTPRYYDKLYKASDGENYEKLQFKRDKAAKARFADNTDARLAVKEFVTKEAIKQLDRSVL